MSETLTIGIDASRLSVPEKTGIEIYAESLITLLPTIRPSLQFRLYVTETPTQQFPNNVKLVILPKKRFWTQTSLSHELQQHPPDIFFSPVYTLPYNHPKIYVITIHGLEFIMTPESYSWWHKIYHRVITRYGIKNASSIITVSENTKKDLIRRYNVNAQSIHVVHNGVIPTKQKRTPSKIPSIVYIGRLETRKNIIPIIHAFSAYKQQYPNNAQLILAGKWGTVGVEDIKNEITSSPFSEDIITPGYINTQEKETLLKEAHVFVFPSRYEGFGLPVLEAMDMGVPVITSRTSSIPEVGGQAVTYVNPIDASSFAQALHDILSSDIVQQHMSQAGKKRSQLFSWKKTASETLRVLLETYKQKGDTIRSNNKKTIESH